MNKIIEVNRKNRDAGQPATSPVMLNTEYLIEARPGEEGAGMIQMIHGLPINTVETYEQLRTMLLES